MKKRVLTFTLALLLCLGLCTSALALDMGKAGGDYNTVSAGAFHTAAIDENGILWTWGDNEHGQLGNGKMGYYSTVPVQVLDNVVAVSCGSFSTAAIRTDGSLWMWGQNSHGELGNGGTGNAQKTEESNYWGSDPGPVQTVPVKVMDDVDFVACAGHVLNYTAAIKTDGSLWMWGQNEYGQLGNGSLEDSNVPVKVMDNVAAVSCGMAHVAAIKTDGSLWMWGNNTCGELGNGGVGNAVYTEWDNTTAPIQTTPVKVLDNVVAISCGNESTAAIKTDGTLWMWGVAAQGALGNGKTPSWDDADFMQKTPVQVMDHVRTVCCFAGDDCIATAAIKDDGSLWMWGGNWYGMLANGKTGHEDEWIQAAPLKVMDSVAAVSGGMAHGVAAKTDGTLWTWGNNSRGQLGNGGAGNNTTDYNDPIQTVPVQIALGSGVSVSRGARLKSGSGFPVLLIAVVVLVAAAAAVALMLYRKGKLNKEGVTEVTAAVTQSAAAGAAKVAATISQAASAGAAKVSETAGKAKTAVKQMGGVTCSCGAVNPVTAKFCQSCGKPVVIPGKCPSCGHQNAPEAKFCQNCGTPLTGGEGTHEA